MQSSEDGTKSSMARDLQPQPLDLAGVRRSEPKVLGWSVRAVSLALALLFSLQQRFYFGIKYLNNHMRYHYKIDS